MEDWKHGIGIMANRLPKSLAKPGPEHMPDAPVEPVMKVCMVIDNILTIPVDVRNMFIQDPVRAPEWRELLVKFDKEYGTPVTAPGPKPEKQDLKPAETAKFFPGEPATVPEFEAKYTPAATFTNGTTSIFKVVEGAKLFLVGTGDVTVSDDKPFLFFFR